MSANGEVEVERVELAELERFEAVDDEWLGGSGLGAVSLEKQQRVPAEPRGVGHDGGGGAVLDAGDLAVAGAGEQRIPGEGEELGALEPVAGGEGL